MRRIGSAAAAALAVLLTACGSSGNASPADTSKAGAQLSKELIPLPGGYVIDPDPGVNGQLSAEAFTAVGGDGSASSAHFVGGYKVDYLSPATHEGIVITLFRFDTASAAGRYLAATAPRTLSAYRPTHRTYPTVAADALALDGSAGYEGNWAHAVVWTKGDVYASVVYLSDGPGAAPVELSEWVQKQYARVS